MRDTKSCEDGEGMKRCFLKHESELVEVDRKKIVVESAIIKIYVYT